MVDHTQEITANYTQLLLKRHSLFFNLILHTRRIKHSAFPLRTCCKEPDIGNFNLGICSHSRSEIKYVTVLVFCVSMTDLNDVLHGLLKSYLNLSL